MDASARSTQPSVAEPAAAVALAATTEPFAAAALALAAAAITLAAAALAEPAAALALATAAVALAAAAPVSLREDGGLRVGDRCERLDAKGSARQHWDPDGRGEGPGQEDSGPVLPQLYRIRGALLCGVLQ